MSVGQERTPEVTDFRVHGRVPSDPHSALGADSRRRGLQSARVEHLRIRTDSEVADSRVPPSRSDSRSRGLQSTR
eukprot:6030617-Alexandrium_andersonii.AAC.1